MKSKLLCLLILAVTACQAGDLAGVRDALIYQWSHLDWRSNAVDFATFDGYLSTVADRSDASDLVRMQAAVTRSLLHAWRQNMPGPPGMQAEIATAYMQLAADTTNTLAAPALIQLAVLRRLTDRATDAVARARYLLAVLHLAHAQRYLAAFPKYYAIVDDQRAAIEWERLRAVLEYLRIYSNPDYTTPMLSVLPSLDFAPRFSVQCAVQADADLTNATLASIERCWLVRACLAVPYGGEFDLVRCSVIQQEINCGARRVSAALPTTLQQLVALTPSPQALEAVSYSAERLPWFQGSGGGQEYGMALQRSRVYLTNSVAVCWRPNNNPVLVLSNTTLKAAATFAQMERLAYQYLSSNAWWLAPHP